MARKQTENPRKRAERIETRRKKLEGRVRNKRTYAAFGREEGELNHRQLMAITMRIAGYKNPDIAEAMGETTKTIEGWFADEDVKGLYMATLDGLSEASMELMRFYMLEAIHTIVDVMRHGNFKEALEASREILDRGGLPKVSRSESTQEKTEVHTVDENLVAQLKEMAADPKAEEALAPLYAELEKAANGED